MDAVSPLINSRNSNLWPENQIIEIQIQINLGLFQPNDRQNYLIHDQESELIQLFQSVPRLNPCEENHPIRHNIYFQNWDLNHFKDFLRTCRDPVEESYYLILSAF